MTRHEAIVGTRPGLRMGHPAAQAAPPCTSDTRGLRASALKIGVAGMSVPEIVNEFRLDRENETHLRRVRRWLVDGAPPDAIAMLPAAVRERYYAALYGGRVAA